MQKYHVSLGSMSTVGANLVKTIRAFAEGTGNDDVYAKAMIPAPAKKTPQPAPGTAKNLTGSINNVGDVELTWNASVIQTTFTVLRRLTKLDGTPATSDWVWVGNTHTKAFTDSTVPAGYASASYRVYAERNGKQSPASSTVEMYFGSTQPSNGEVAGSIGTDDAMAA
jgi:hypothetical protein